MSELAGYELPTPEDTANALAKIAPARSDLAATALLALSEAVIKAVTTVDLTYNLHPYLNSIKIIPTAERGFRLEIDDKNTGVDTHELCRRLTEQHGEPGSQRQYRSIQLERTDSDG